MAVNGTLGSKLFITSAAMASTIDSEAEFSAQTWVEIGLIESFGEFGRVFDMVPFQAIADGRTYKLKGGFNDGAFQFTLGQDLTDAGQTLLKTAADSSSQDNYGFRIEFNDAPSSVGGPTTFFFRGLAMSFRTQMGAANAVIRVMSNIEVNSPLIHAPAAELYDRFITGGSLAHYFLVDGSDAQATAPAISANTLVAITGDAGTGYAADGTQAIALAGYIPSAGAITVEARIKLSAITTVAMFFGLTDQAAALEAPIESAASADTITTNATDAVGFFFDTAMSTDNIWLAGVNNNSDETHQDSALAFVADTYKTLRVTLNTSGDATFYIDGTAIGSVMTTAVATGVTLYPTICAAARSTSSRTLTADYLYARQD
jgi:hypothetical protein